MPSNTERRSTWAAAPVLPPRPLEAFAYDRRAARGRQRPPREAARPAWAARRPAARALEFGSFSSEILRAVDAAVAAAAATVAFVVADAAGASGAGTPAGPLAHRLPLRDVLLLGGCVVVWCHAFVLAGLYDGARARTARQTTAAAAAACAAGVALLAFLSMAGNGVPLGPAQMLELWAATTAAVLAARAALARLTAAAPRPRPRVLIVGTGPRAQRLYADLCATPGAAHHLVGFVDATDGRAAADRTGEHRAGAVRTHYLGTPAALEAILMREVVDEVLIALPVKSQYAEIQRVIDTCARAGVECRYPVDIFHAPLGHARLDLDTGAPLVRVPVACDDRRLTVKRAVDVAATLAALALCAPLLLLIMAAVRLESPGPAFFVQERCGYHRRRFRMLKFRTMVTDAAERQAALEALNEASGPVFKIARDPRVTRVGAFLRRTSLDELPQLVNVLLGHMSLVGPRPLPVRDVDRFDAAWLMRRFSVRPGLTCLWQISGRSTLGFDDWIALDLAYIDDWSLRLDFEILLRTVPAVLRGTGAH